MIKNYLVISIFLFLAKFNYAQWFPYNSREWDINWTITKFSESFNDVTLDTEKWDVMINFGRGNCMFRDLPNVTYSVDGQYLNLNMIYQPGSCFLNDNGDTICPAYISGEVWSDEQFKYGIYEGRMKFATQRGSWPAFWFFGGSDSEDPLYSNGYHSEIDIAEYNWYSKWYGYDPTTEHVLHWWGPQGALPIGGETKVEAPVDWDNWHTFKLIYTPYYLEFYTNGTLNWKKSRFYIINGTGEKLDINVEQITESTVYYKHEGFPQHAGHIILSQQASGNVEMPLVAPQTSLFDWVTFKQFFLAPEITLSSDNICASGTATASLDEDASDISWSLSPASLFTGTTSGSYTTASINVASTASGLGKITFTFKMGDETFTVDKSFWAGKPYINPNSIVFSNSENGSGNLCINMIGNNFSFTFDHDYDYFDIKLTNLAQTQTLCNYTIYSTSGDLDICSFSEGTYLFWVRGKNNCSTIPGPWSKSSVTFEDCMGIMMMMTPNPVTTETTISLVSTSEIEELDYNEGWELEVIGLDYSVKLKEPKIKKKDYILKTNNWKEGNYIVRAKYKDKVVTDKLVVKK